MRQPRSRMERVLRSKGAAMEPTKMVITGATVMRRNFENEIGKNIEVDTADLLFHVIH